MENQTAFKGGVILPGRILDDGYVACQGGRIADIGIGAPPPGFDIVEGKFISPGFVDIHVHGAANADYMDGSEEAVRISNRAHAKHGTTSIFPTTTTGTFAELDSMIAACEKVRHAWEPGDGAHIAGIHFYGPYFAAEKVGVHSVTGRRDPVREEYEYFLGKPIVRIATCAAELPGALDFYRFAESQGCFITCGHSNASWQELEAGFEHGVRHVDHFWCAMSSVSSLRQRFGTPMRASMEQYVLYNDDMSTEVIADGVHLSDELLRFAYKMMRPARLCLVTDANRALDCPPGDYRFGPQETGTLVVSDGEAVRGRDGGLASSMHGMDHMVKTMWKATGAPLYNIVNMASLTPAKLAGVSSKVGSLETGKTADILVLSEDLDIDAVYLAGRQFT